ncbi:hypothetical protein PU629_20705 [Pullulanibacillus sp. KACC 23026]|uniref:hypothetical protein n=1 Tax=Pullulanibacillus sp. KACC 23026 TaxID=3028315 RepID=UPI0023B00FFB|nr:hypothetical protein [Pullulanibacillus sp. KACC 23026]WEG12490.1 hypothetical protein PU629_20705 [Pullulanibacillus sp. KACC 23026]
MNDKAKARLYTLTSISCFAWLVQAMLQDRQKGQMWSLLNLIFYGCIILVILYTAYSAVQMWKMNGKSVKKQQSLRKQS